MLVLLIVFRIRVSFVMIELPLGVYLILGLWFRCLVIVMVFLGLVICLGLALWLWLILQYELNLCLGLCLDFKLGLML